MTTNRKSESSRTTAGSLTALALVLLAVYPGQQVEAETIFEPYSARYAVYRNGKLQARSEFLFQQQGDAWIIKSESIGTHGMARFMKFRDFEYVEGQFDGTAFRPLRYVHDLKWIGPDQNTSAEFDWESNLVSVTHEDETRELDLVEDAVDPMSLQLELRDRLANPDKALEFMLVEDDEIELQKFRTLPLEQMETSLGCLSTIPVEKVRENSRRYTRSWHASEFLYIPVRMEHGKTDGDHMELRITELTIAGNVVQPQPGCAAQQGG